MGISMRMAVLLLSIIGWGHAWGIDAQGRFLMRGLGTTPCRAFLVEASGLDRFKYETWLGGYFSGLNTTMPDTYDIGGMGLNAIGQGLDWIREYCQRNPHNKMGDGAQALVESLSPTRQRNPPPEQLPSTRHPRAK